jgi:hypothetical protein
MRELLGGRSRRCWRVNGDAWFSRWWLVSDELK